jgi:type IV pilus assembly protein PilB
MYPEDESITQILTDVGLVSRADLAQAKEQAQVTGKSVVQILLEAGRLTEMDITKALASQFGLEVMDLNGYRIAPEVLAVLSRDQARQWKVLPIFKRGNQLTVAIANPLDMEAVDKLGETLSLSIQPVVSCLSDIEAALDRYYGC